jgi:hypothetical protein
MSIPPETTAASGAPAGRDARIVTPIGTGHFRSHCYMPGLSLRRTGSARGAAAVPAPAQGCIQGRTQGRTQAMPAE